MRSPSIQYALIPKRFGHSNGSNPLDRLPNVKALGKLLDSFLAEGTQVVWLPTCHQALITDASFINPVGSRVDQISPKTWPGSNRPPLHDSRFDECPRSMADGGNGFG